MGIAGAGLVASAVVLQLLICQAYGQLADNLIVSGSDKPMAYGVGTYGLKGAGSQGISGQSQGGGLYSQKIPTFTLSKRVPGVIVSDGKHRLKHRKPLHCFLFHHTGQRQASVHQVYVSRCQATGHLEGLSGHSSKALQSLLLV